MSLRLADNIAWIVEQTRPRGKKILCIRYTNPCFSPNFVFFCVDFLFTVETKIKKDSVRVFLFMQTQRGKKGPTNSCTMFIFPFKYDSFPCFFHLIQRK